MKITVILGTRPEIIKMSPVIRELENRLIDYFVIHTGQHYSYNMDKVFFKQLNLSEAKYNLEVGSGLHGEQTAKMLNGIEKILVEEHPDFVLVEGDTNTVLSGTLAAIKLHIRVGHVEAGLRSGDRSMPEEINRIITDHCSDFLFAPTEKSKNNLLGEGIPNSYIYVTGNTIVDAIFQNLEIAKQNYTYLNELNVEPGKYFLATLHRQENVDNSTRFGSILKSFDLMYDKFHLPIICPIHPRSRKMMIEFGLRADSMQMIDPVDYFSFLQLEKGARLILTDSGGVQEEGCILGVPCVTLRDNTERPETIEQGANILAGTDTVSIFQCSEIMLQRKNSWHNPFGDGKASEKILKILEARNG
jgi:UDP-N-acetylglucosamine 2-epimerase (non-hydrolysing)